MNYTTGNRWTGWIIASLVILNIVLLGSFWYSHFKSGQETAITGTGQSVGDVQQPVEQNTNALPLDDKRRTQQDRRLAEYLKREMNYSQSQVEQFFKLRQAHHAKIQVLNKQMDKSRRQMMDMLLTENPDLETVKKITARIGGYLSQIEEQTFKHFLDLMNIGDQDQRQKYKQLLREILHQLRPPQPAGQLPQPQQPPLNRFNQQGQPPRLGPPPEGHPPPPFGRGPPPKRLKEREKRK